MLQLMNNATKKIDFTVKFAPHINIDKRNLVPNCSEIN